MTDIAQRPHTDAIVARLETAGYQVGRSQAPLGVQPPYWVLYPIESAGADGSLSDPDADWPLQYQITSVGVGPEQAEDMSVLARGTLRATPLSVTGRTIWRVRVDAVGRVDRDDGFQPPVFFQADTITLLSSPA